jgi:hypothetical protein
MVAEQGKNDAVRALVEMGADLFATDDATAPVAAMTFSACSHDGEDHLDTRALLVELAHTRGNYNNKHAHTASTDSFTHLRVLSALTHHGIMPQFN